MNEFQCMRRLTHSKATCAPFPCAISERICAASFVQLSPVINFVHFSSRAISNKSFSLDPIERMEEKKRHSKNFYFRRRSSSSRAVRDFVRENKISFKS